MGNSINLSWQLLLSKLLLEGAAVSPRGKLCRELIGSHLVASMDRPILSIKDRRLGYRFMCAEAAWILSGDNRVSTIAPYSRTISSFSDDGQFFFGAYGPMVVDQLSYVVGRILRDHDTRQAVLSIWRRNPGQTNDVPCTLTVQFLLRENTLHTLLNMRSSDAWLGVPYDFFNFSMLSGYVALLLRRLGKLEVRLGDLHLYAGSHHLYDENITRARELDFTKRHDFLGDAFDPLVQFSSPDELVEHLWHLARLEHGKCTADFFNYDIRELYKYDVP